MYKTFKLLLILLLVNNGLLKAQIKVSANTDTIGAYNVYELTILHPRSYTNNWDDVKVTVLFQGPQNITISGFFYDTNTWKVRFAPPATGDWTYQVTFTTPTISYLASGSFTCIPSGNKGFLQRHPSNPFRLVYADGTLFNGIGFEDCVYDQNNDGTPLDDFGFDGETKPNFVGLNTYMPAYGKNGAGFNLYRWTTDNCSFKLYNSITTTGNDYNAKNGMYGDTLVQSLKNNGIRIWLTFFGPPVFNNIDGSNLAQDTAIKKYISYVVARYGAYADIWELFNESTASDYYYNTITAYIRSIDPYHRLISVSDQRPQLSCIDINSPHWYEKESELQSDERAYTMISSRKSFQKPIIFGEQGNSVQNWDPLSAERMRLRVWTSFFTEGILIFWNTSFAKNFMNSHAANIYLGPQERGYIRAMQDFTVLADSSTTITQLEPSNPAQVRAYGLASSKMIMGYFHHYNTHANSVNTQLNLRLRRTGTVYWINPADGKVIITTDLPYGRQTIRSPAFNIDLAMRIVLSDQEPVFDQTQKLDLVVYPNPSTSQFAVDGNFNGTATVTLYNESGRKILVKNNVANDQMINIEGLLNGIYIYKVSAGSRIASGKLIVAR